MSPPPAEALSGLLHAVVRPARLPTHRDLERGPLNHFRLGIGAEIMTRVLEFRTNGYIGLSGARRISQDPTQETFERALTGMDAEAGGAVPYLPFMKLYGGFSHYACTRASDADGGTFRAEIELTRYLRIDVQTRSDNKTSEYRFGLGSYNEVRTTISCTFRIKGSVTFGGTTYYTTASGAASTSAAALAEAAVTIPSSSCPSGVLTDTSSVNVAVAAGQPTTINVVFDVTGSIRLDGAPLIPAISPGVPTVTVTQ